MTRYRRFCSTLLLFALTCAVSLAIGQDSPPTESPSPRRSEARPTRAEAQPDQPPVSIGGPFGVLIGGGRGLRIGGRNGVQFGGGRGAVFGGRNGVQMGGGEGLRIGPAPVPNDSAEAAGVDVPLPEVPDDVRSHQITLHHLADAPESLRLRVGEQDVTIVPGQAIQFDGQRRVSVQIVNADGRVRSRRTLTPGSYVSRKSRRGWTVARGELPTDEAQIPNPPPSGASETVHEFESLELVPPTVEILPTPQPAIPNDGGGASIIR